MSLSSGARLGPYEIVAPLGAGGMGEVYQARDTRLDRTVAVKVLPEHLSESEALRRRFEQEARAVSSLNHPHICALYDVGREGSVDFMVMEHVEGETLAARLEKGPLPLDQALQYATEIADALHKAHRQGVVHRDLKPGNLILTKSGTKLLDFGLARSVPPTEASGREPSSLPTRDKPITEKGTILGTFRYMAPEQLEGKDVDARTDLFALGAVLYEMVTGKKAFEGESRASLISAIMSGEPRPMSELGPVVPAALERVVEKCLAKDPDERWQTALDLRDEIGWIREGGGRENRAPVRTNLAPWIAALAATAAAAGLGVWALVSSGAPAGPIKHLSIPLPLDVTLPSARGTLIAVSPDGTKIAFMGEREGVEQLFLRSMEEPHVRAIPGTEGAQHPAFSPDGKEIAFDVESRLHKISLAGGPAVPLASFGSYPDWGADGYIYFWSEGLWRVPSAGGEVLSVTPTAPLEQATPNGRPKVLPNGKAVLYEGTRADGTLTVELLSLESGDVRSVVPEGSNPRYVSSGHILFARSDTVLALPFDLDALRVAGQAVPLDRDVRVEVGGAAQFAFGNDGTLVYAESALTQKGSLTLVDRQGASRPIGESIVGLRSPRISPDGRRVAVGVLDDVWIYEFERGVMTRFTFESVNFSPIWSPDGERIAFSRGSFGRSNVFVKPVRESEEAQAVTSGEFASVTSWSSDTMIVQSLRSHTQWDIDVVRLHDGRRETILGTRFDESQGVLSPDGRWLAYVSSESGRAVVFVVPFPDARRKWQISTEGGREPMWARDGRTLYYRAGNKMMSVAMETEPELTPGRPRALLEVPYAAGSLHTNYDVSPGGDGFIMIQQEETEARTELQIVLNSFQELEAVAPPSR